MHLTHSSHVTRLVARFMCWVMLSAFAAGALNACTAPGAGAVLSAMAARTLHAMAALELPSSEPCHVERQGLPASPDLLDAGACRTLCEAEPSGRVMVKADMPPPLALAALPQEPWTEVSPGEAPERLHQRHPTAKPLPPPVAILFLRLTI